MRLISFVIAIGVAVGVIAIGVAGGIYLMQVLPEISLPELSSRAERLMIGGAVLAAAVIINMKENE